MARSKLKACPSYVKELNENLYELCAPAGVPEIEIIFFHGLQLGDYKDAFWRTWLSRDETVLWPKDWLGRSFPGARILSISYDSCATKTPTSGDEDMYNIGENLLHNVILSGQSNVGQNCPVVLVGHSLGGLAIKHFVLFSHHRRAAMDRSRYQENYNRVDKFLTNFRGVFYYSAPHGGTRLADSVIKIPCINARDTLRVLTTLNKDTARINEDFREWRGIHHQSTFSVVEAFPTKIAKWYNGKVVEEASARHDTDGFIMVTADHYNVCKPERLTNNSFLSLRDFISTVAVQAGRPITYQAVDARQENESLR